MKMIIRQTQLYNFLNFCNKSGLQKNVLDCGAGGDCPPLSLFHFYGYEIRGIELNEEQMIKANEFAKERGLELNISQGNMLYIPFEDELTDIQSFSGSISGRLFSSKGQLSCDSPEWLESRTDPVWRSGRRLFREWQSATGSWYRCDEERDTPVP